MGADHPGHAFNQRKNFAVPHPFGSYHSNGPGILSDTVSGRYDTEMLETYILMLLPDYNLERPILLQDKRQTLSFLKQFKQSFQNLFI